MALAAAGTGAWQGFQEAVAGWFGRGDEERERVELERLDRCAAAIEAVRTGDAGAGDANPRGTPPCHSVTRTAWTVVNASRGAAVRGGSSSRGECPRPGSNATFAPGTTR